MARAAIAATPSVPENEVRARLLEDAAQLRKEAWQIINGAKNRYTRDYLRRVIDVLYRLRTAGDEGRVFLGIDWAEGCGPAAGDEGEEETHG